MAIVGRDPFVDIVLPFPQVNARHALLEPLGAGRYHLLDLGSSNGTRVAGRRVETAQVSDGDAIDFAGIRFDWGAHRALLDAEASLPRGITLGRDPSCEIALFDARISGRHLRVIPQDDHLLIVDLGSAGGLFVNGQIASRALVSPTDRIRLGAMPLDLFALVTSARAGRCGEA